MFFVLSKTIGLFAQPLYLALLLLALAGLLRLLQRAPRLRRWIVVLSLAGLWLASTDFFANLLLAPLETRFQRPAAGSLSPGAIVMLSGVTRPYAMGQGYYELGTAADRIVEAVRLARTYPRAMLILSGGSSNVVDTSYREADVLGRLAKDLGIPARRIKLDRQSRNTRENAVESHKLLSALGIKGPVLLVTSASHLPRAVACFAKVGVRVIPWPTDFARTHTAIWLAWVPTPQALLKTTLALREIYGYLAYWMMGYV